MAQNASDSQKVDYLWKKIVYGAAKTDISGNIDATNEPNPSPLQIRADKILQDSASIPGVIPGSNSSVVTVYPTTFPVECISTAAIPTPTLTWQTSRTFWVPPEFGSTYQIKVYIAPSGNAANVASKGTQVFATGSGFNDLWVFDYQAGILNFNSNNTPYSGGAPISFTGNSVYISGAVYAGAFGLPSTANIGNVILGNITFSNTTISTSLSSANIILTPTGTGAVKVSGTGAVGLPSGTSAQRPTTVAIGYTRFNTDVGEIESWDGSAWVTPGQAVITSDVINPNGTSNTYSLSSNSTTSGVLVSINGTIQQPYTAYNIISNNQIQFTEIPLTTDIVEVRHMAQGASTISSLQAGNTSVILDGIANVNVVNNLVVSNDIYFVGNLYQNGNLFSSSGTANPTYFTSSNLVTTATTLIDSIPVTGNVGVLWTTTSIDNANNNYKSSLINSVNDGANVFYNESSIVRNNANVVVAAFTSNIVGGNLTLWAVGDSGNVTVSFQRTLLGKQTPFGYIASGARGFTGATGPAGTIGNTSSVIQSTNATPSTSTSTGGLIVTGGAGIGGNLNVGGPVNTFAGNILPASNVAYSLGSLTSQWKDLYVSSNTIYIGGSAVSVVGGQLSIGGNVVTGTAPYGNTNVQAYTETMGFQNYSNVNVAAYTTTQSYTNYSNVNVAAYTTTQSYTNYSNVNVAAYTTTQSYTNYSNVNVAAYSQTQSYTNYSNVNLSAYLGGAVTIGGNLTVIGNLFVNGNLTTINANNLIINDSMIYLADDNPADTLDIGFVSAFTSAVRYQHTGFVRDATDGVWKLFANVVAEPTTTIDFTNATYANLQVGNIAGTITTASQPNITTVGTLGNLAVTGNITVSSNVVFSGWSVRETGTKLYFAYNGVNKMSLETNGNLTVTGDVIAFGNIT